MAKVNVMYDITVPIYNEDEEYRLTNDENIYTVISIFDKYGIKWNTCDTIAGSFNLNQEWVETNTDIEADTTWNSVLPTNWSNYDITVFHDLIKSGKIIVRVFYKEKNKNGEISYIPHH